MGINNKVEKMTKEEMRSEIKDLELSVQVFKRDSDMRISMILRLRQLRLLISEMR